MKESLWCILVEDIEVWASSAPGVPLVISGERLEIELWPMAVRLAEEIFCNVD